MNIEQLKAKYLGDSIGAFGGEKNPIKKRQMREDFRIINEKKSFKRSQHVDPGEATNFEKAKNAIRKVEDSIEDLKSVVRMNKYLNQAVNKIMLSCETFKSLLKQKSHGSI